MTGPVLSESGMMFGPYEADRCFYIEKSGVYRQIREGVQMAEFLLLRFQAGRPVVWVVEAKSSTPRPERPSFRNFIDDIHTKLTNGFLLGMAICLGRHPDPGGELPEPFRKLSLTTSSFRFVLVIHGHKDAWLPPLQDALSLVFKPIVKSWALPPTSVMVLNENGAKRCGLIGP
ncbi:MAG: hypothetical protein HQL88_03350 [Magnetococcales bacterium]|nr:hypothetical protein [Magnetococcales bacterium]